MASRALTARLRITCSIWPGSARMSARSGADGDDQFDVLADQPPQHLVEPRDHAVEVHQMGSRTCFRLNARSCWSRPRPGSRPQNLGCVSG